MSESFDGSAHENRAFSDDLKSNVQTDAQLNLYLYPSQNEIKKINSSFIDRIPLPQVRQMLNTISEEIDSFSKIHIKDQHNVSRFYKNRGSGELVYKCCHWHSFLDEDNKKEICQVFIFLQLSSENGGALRLIGYGKNMTECSAEKMSYYISNTLYDIEKNGTLLISAIDTLKQSHSTKKSSNLLFREMNTGV